MTIEIQKNQHCPNPNCTTFGKVDGKNIAIHDPKNNRFRCRLCKKTWVGHRREYTYGLKTNLAITNRAFELLKAGYSIRTTAKFSHVSPSTVMRWKKRMNIN